MAGTAQKWFVGCGIGCGLFLLLALGAGTVGYFGVRKAMDRGEDIEAGFEELQAQYGPADEFVPEMDGSVPAGRMEVFLEARRQMAGERKVFGDILRTLDDLEVDGAKPNFIAKAKAGIQVIPAMMTFLDQRNQVLLEQGMGLGEYQYIYSLGYYILLDKSLADGPSFTLTSDSAGEGDNGFHWKASGSGDDADTAENRERAIRSHLHRVQLQMAENQLAALDSRGGSPEDRELLTAEIARMEAEPLRLLWETEMPEAVRGSLEPYLEQMDALYDPMINLLESGLIENE